MPRDNHNGGAEAAEAISRFRFTVAPQRAECGGYAQQRPGLEGCSAFIVVAFMHEYLVADRVVDHH